MNALDLLARDHQPICELFAQLPTEDSATAWRRTAHQLIDSRARHGAAEGRVPYRIERTPGILR